MDHKGTTSHARRPFFDPGPFPMSCCAPRHRSDTVRGHPSPSEESMRSATANDVVFLSAKRTPFGAFGGALKDLSATDLAVHASKAALAQGGVPADAVDHVVF